MCDLLREWWDVLGGLFRNPTFSPPWRPTSGRHLIELPVDLILDVRILS